tara:strand:- start:1283 stop:1465 length:183 start_codon:yes stop_codon:yes gene_type:complete
LNVLEEAQIRKKLQAFFGVPIVGSLKRWELLYEDKEKKNRDESKRTGTITKKPTDSGYAG